MIYKILEASSKDDLERKVNMLLNDDWIVEGGVSIASDAEGNITYVQAMLLYTGRDD